MLSNINKHFFPDKEVVNQSFMYLRGEISIESCSKAIEEIIMCNVPQFDETEEGELVPTGKEDVINLLITSSGGDMSAAFALINIIQGSKVPIRTIALGEASSAALCILMSGHQRVVTPYTSLMSHSFSTGTEGSYQDIKNIMKEFDVYYEKMVALYKKHTGLSDKLIKKQFLSQTDYWIPPEKAVEYNIVDLHCDLS